MSIAIQELVQAWLLLPAVFIVASLTLGMAVFKLSDLDLKSPLVLPAGFSALVVVGQISTMNWLIAPYTAAIVLVLTLLSGFYFKREFLPWFEQNKNVLLLGFIVFYLHGLPILLSKTPTFAGWIKLDDGSTFLAMTDQMLLASRNTSILAPSTHEATVQILLNQIGLIHYPSGSFVTLGVLSKWLFIDPAWLLQPYMAAGAMMLSFALFALLKPIEISNWVVTMAVVVVPTSALYLGYEMWGGIKEVLLVPIIIMATALIPIIVKRFNEPRCVVAFALACSAFVEIYSIFGLAWLFISALYLLVSLTRALREIPWAHILVFIGTFVFCSISTLYFVMRYPSGDLATPTGDAQDTSYIANLIGPLKFSQIFGVWLTGDFRYPANYPLINTALILLAGLLFVLGCYFLLINGHSHIAALAIWVTLICAAGLKGSPWISGKWLAMANPIVLTVIFCAIGFIALKFTLEAWVLAVTLSSGVFASYVYTFHEVWLAPYEQLKELEVIGNSDSYASPALMIEYSPYGARHFLRKLDPESAGEFRRNLIPLRTGLGLDKGATADIDEFALSSIEAYQTLVLRKSANSSRPPSNYNLKFSGLYYEVWTKNPNLIEPIYHYSFGNKDLQSAIPECSFIESEIAPKVPGNVLLVSSGTSSLWLPISDVTGTAQGKGKHSVFESKFKVTSDGSYDLWVAGFVKGRASVVIDDSPITTIAHMLNGWGSTSKIADVQLSSGSHVLRVVTDSPWFVPGSGGLSYPMGPFYLSDPNEKHSIEVVSPKNLNSLCTKPVDWIELVPK